MDGSGDPGRRVSKAVNEDQTQLDLEAGPLARAIVFERGGGEGLLLALTLHHLVVDYVSMLLLLDDLRALYDAQDVGQSIPAPAGPAYADLANALERVARSSDLESEMGYWASVLDAEPGLSLLRLDSSPAARPTESDARTILHELPEDLTEMLLTSANRSYNTKPEDLILTALARVLLERADGSDVVVGLERHGRLPVAGVDPSTVVGWLTSFFPLRVPSLTHDVGSDVTAIKECLRSVPNGGIGFGLLAAGEPLSPHGDRWTNVIFNYLGAERPDASGRFALTEGPEVNARSGRCERYAALEINSRVVSNRLRSAFKHTTELDGDDMDALVASFDYNIRKVIEHCTGTDSVRFTPSDFPEAELDQEDLDRLFGNSD
jgi:non-ribosomal peptide synthase protein (TIGR01720 family)